jgi:hypothetical protein
VARVSGHACVEQVTHVYQLSVIRERKIQDW